MAIEGLPTNDPFLAALVEALLGGGRPVNFAAGARLPTTSDLELGMAGLSSTDVGFRQALNARAAQEIARQVETETGWGAAAPKGPMFGRAASAESMTGGLQKALAAKNAPALKKMVAGLSAAAAKGGSKMPIDVSSPALKQHLKEIEILLRMPVSERINSVNALIGGGPARKLLGYTPRKLLGYTPPAAAGMGAPGGAGANAVTKAAATSSTGVAAKAAGPTAERLAASRKLVQSLAKMGGGAAGMGVPGGAGTNAVTKAAATSSGWQKLVSAIKGGPKSVTGKGVGLLFKAALPLYLLEWIVNRGNQERAQKTLMEGAAENLPSGEDLFMRNILGVLTAQQAPGLVEPTARGGTSGVSAIMQLLSQGERGENTPGETHVGS